MTALVIFSGWKNITASARTGEYSMVDVIKLLHRERDKVLLRINNIGH